MAKQATSPYKRRRILVNPSLQRRFAHVMLLALAVLTMGALACTYLALWIAVTVYGLRDDPVTTMLFSTVGLMITFELVLIAPCVAWFAILQTHKIAGPLVRIMTALERMTQGDFTVHVKLREGDAINEVADAVNRLAESLRARKR